MLDVPPPLDIGFFRLARKVSKKSNYKIKMGACICNKKKVISVSENKIKTHPKFANPELNQKPTIHAEIGCLINAKSNLDGSSIYVFRENKWGKPMLARPCKDCMRQLKLNGIKNVYYSIEHYPYFIKERI